ncbi:hypothetical protein OY671_008083, partial [Metschnikowia pulcherrima]
RQTGYVEALKPIERQTIAPDAASTRSFLVQYVIARESFDRPSLKANYRKTASWSAPEARAAYVAAMQATNPASPSVTLPQAAQVEVQVKSVSSSGPQTSLVRFRTHRADGGASGQGDRDWAAVISYRYSGEPMTVADRSINPLGFEVTRYRRDAETIPVDPQTAGGTLPSAVAGMPGASGPVFNVPVGNAAGQRCPGVDPAGATMRHFASRLASTLIVAASPIAAPAQVRPIPGAYDARIQTVVWHRDEVVKSRVAWASPVTIEFGGAGSTNGSGGGGQGDPASEHIANVTSGESRAWQVAVARDGASLP